MDRLAEARRAAWGPIVPAAIVFDLSRGGYATCRPGAGLPLTKAQCAKLAGIGHGGLAGAVRPARSIFDGDTIFGLPTSRAVGEDGAVRDSGSVGVDSPAPLALLSPDPGRGGRLVLPRGRARRVISHIGHHPRLALAGLSRRVRIRSQALIGTRCGQAREVEFFPN